MGMGCVGEDVMGWAREVTRRAVWVGMVGLRKESKEGRKRGKRDNRRVRRGKEEDMVAIVAVDFEGVVVMGLLWLWGSKSCTL